MTAGLILPTATSLLLTSVSLCVSLSSPTHVCISHLSYSRLYLSVYLSSLLLTSVSLISLTHVCISLCISHLSYSRLYLSVYLTYLLITSVFLCVSLISLLTSVSLCISSNKCSILFSIYFCLYPYSSCFFCHFFNVLFFFSPSFPKIFSH